MIEATSNYSRMNQKEKMLNVSNASKTGNATMTNSCLSTDKSPSSFVKTRTMPSKREVNELLSYMISSLESTNSALKQKVQPSIDLSVFDHLNLIKRDIANGTVKHEKPQEKQIDKSAEINPYVYPNSYNLVSTSKRYEILAEIRDRTDERVLQYEEVLEKLFGNLKICNKNSPYMNIINEQKKRLRKALNKSNSNNKGFHIDGDDYTSMKQNRHSDQRNSSTNKNETVSYRKDYSLKGINQPEFDDSFGRSHQEDILQKVILDKDKKKKFNQCSFSMKSNSKKNNNSIKQDQPLTSTLHNSSQAIARNESAGSFIDKENKSLRFSDNKSLITNDKSGCKSPIR